MALISTIPISASSSLDHRLEVRLGGMMACRKRLLASILIGLVVNSSAMADQAQNFDTWPTRSNYTNDDYQGWIITNCAVDSLYAYQGQAARLQSTAGNYILSPEIPGGIGTISFRIRKYLSSDVPFTLQIQVSSNGVSWTTLTNVSAAATNYQQIGIFHSDTTNHFIRLYHSAGAARVLVDDIRIERLQPRPDVVVATGFDPALPVADEPLTLIAYVEPRYGASVRSVTGYYRVASGSIVPLSMDSVGYGFYASRDKTPALPVGAMIRFYVKAQYSGIGANPAFLYYSTNLISTSTHTNYMSTQTFGRITAQGDFISTNNPLPNMINIARTGLWESDHHITNTANVTLRFIADMVGYSWGMTNGAESYYLPASGAMAAGSTNFAQIAMGGPGRYRIAFNHLTGGFSFRRIYFDDSLGTLQNMIKNPGFELTTLPDGGDAESWNAGQSWPKSAVDGFASHSGNWCGAIFGQLQPEWFNFASFSQDVLVASGERYRVGAWLNATPDWTADSMQIRITWRDQASNPVGNDSILEIPSLSVDWIKYSLECVAPANAANAQVGFLCSGAGTTGSMHIDDVEMTVAWSPPQDFVYTTNSPDTNTIAIIGYTGPGGAVNIPPNIWDQAVTDIGGHAFAYCSNLTSITIPSGITTIGPEAFLQCTGLVGAAIGDDVVVIGSGAFYSCTNLSRLVVGDGVTNIGPNVFNTSNLESLVIGDGVANIGDGAWTFRGCSSLTNLVIGNGVTNIGPQSFDSCSNLSCVVIPDSVIRIGDGAFIDCSSLTNLVIGRGVTRIGDHSFYSCSELTSLTIPDSVRTIDSGSFSGCTGLESVVIGAGTAEIVPNAFDGCTNIANIVYNSNALWPFSCQASLTNLAIGDSVNSISPNMYAGYSALSAVTIGDSVTNIGSGAFITCTSLAHVVIGNAVTSIANNVFYSSNLTSVLIGNGLAAIGEELTMLPPQQSALWDFDGCVRLTNIVLGDGIQRIGTRAFLYCTNLTSIAVPDNVYRISDQAFMFCSGLTNVAIGDGVASVGSQVFIGCDSLVEITVDADNPDYSSTNGVLFNKAQSTLVQCPGGKAGSYTIPAGVTSVGDHAFYMCGCLTDISIPSGVVAIGNSALEWCTGLTDIWVDVNNPVFSSFGGVLFNRGQTSLVQCPGGRPGGYSVPAGVTNIGYGAFAGCTSLSEISVGHGVGRIGSYAFGGCSNLASVTFGSNVANIGDMAFWYCSGLTGLFFCGDVPVTDDLVGLFTSNRVVSVYYLWGRDWPGEWAGQLTSPWQPHPNYSVTVNSANMLSITRYEGAGGTVVVPSDIEGIPVTCIGANAFNGRTDLMGITLPNSVTTVEDGSFWNCTSLTNVMFGAGVASIGYSVFQNCTSLTCVTLPASVTNIGGGAFSDCYSLTSVYFLGDAPVADAAGVFYATDNAIIYYLPGTTGWPVVPDLWPEGLYGRPTAHWLPKVMPEGFGVQAGQYGFNVGWAEGQTVVVDACTNLAGPVWIPLATNTLGDTDYFFGDNLWTNYPGRFYRIRQLP